MLMVIAACTLGVFPQEAFASGPASRPVFYYYHTDHLGSSSILTDRTGVVVQHYEYSAFGKSRYEHNNQAYKVTDRYTGQKLDEDTGLYFYNSRYYDPELARFTQADTIVPSATTSQALNRYAYVKNNPLKFTDPTGHGWFKKWIGTIISVALMFIPGMQAFALQGFWQFVIAGTISSAIGSAVSTVVNGGSWSSFAIGVGIGFAASVLTAGIGSMSGGFEGLALSLEHSTITMVIHSTIQGAISGAITSAVYGQNVLRGMGEGALGGVIGAGIGYAIGAAISFGYNVVKDLSQEYVIQASVFPDKPEPGEVVTEEAAWAVWKDGYVDPVAMQNWQTIKEWSFLSTLADLVPTGSGTLKIMQVAYGQFAGEWHVLYADTIVNAEYGTGQYWHATIYKQDYVYQRTLFNWKLHWVPKGKPYSFEVTAGKFRGAKLNEDLLVNFGTGGYTTKNDAHEGIIRARMNMVYEQGRYGGSRWRK